MDRIAVIGTSWRTGGSESLARLALPREEIAARLPELAAALGADELLYLATCNRVEIAYRSAADPAEARRRVLATLTGRTPAPGEAERTLRAWAGEGAVEHLFLVACGLDSARVGESEIAGQLQSALAWSREAGLASGRLGEVALEALRLSRHVRRRAALDLGHTSLAEIALELIRERLSIAPGTVALLGVSAMTERCGRALVRDGVPLVVVNRTVERAEELARALGGVQAVSLEAFRAEPGAVAALVSATGAREPIFDRAALERIARAAGAVKPRIIDLGVPCDVDPGDAFAAGIEHASMDTILARAERTREERLSRAADARVEVDRALDALRARFGRRSVDALVVALRTKYAAALEIDLEHVLRRELSGLDAAERAALEGLGRRLVARFAHVPSKGLRELARRLGPQAVEAFLAGADSGLALEVAAEVARSTSHAAVERLRASAFDAGGET